MKGKKFRPVCKLLVLSLILGFTFLGVQESFGQKIEYNALKGLGWDRKGRKPPPPKTKVPKKKENKPTSNARKLTVEITAFPSTVHAGKSYTFMAKAEGGTAPYQYSWSGLSSAGGKSTGMLSKSHANMSFKTLGNAIIAVRVIDANNDFAMKKVKVRVVR